MNTRNQSIIAQLEAKRTIMKNEKERIDLSTRNKNLVLSFIGVRRPSFINRPIISRNYKNIKREEAKAYGYQLAR